MKHNAEWYDTNIQHIIGVKYHKDFNVDLPINKIIVSKPKHRALNTLMNEAQNPREQLKELFMNWWLPVLSEEVKQRLIDILNIPDKDFYRKDLVKNKK